LKAIGYVRVSTQEQSDHGVSLEAQEARIRAYCATRSLDMVDIIQDAGVSGATPIDERPGLVEALAMLARGDVLVVARRDRLARDVVIAAILDRLVEGKGAHIESVDGAGNGDGPTAELIRTIMTAFAQYERARIRLATKAALATKKARGEVVGTVPYGFKRVGDRLVDVPDEQEVIRLAKSMHANGLSLRNIAARLSHLGHSSRSGVAFHPTQIARMVA
jgi:site-specific DNA recombinase